MDRYDKKFQKYILGEALKGNLVLMENTDYGVLISDGKMVKILNKDECYIKVQESRALSHFTFSIDKSLTLSDNYTYTKVKGVKNLCLKIDDVFSLDSKYIQFFDLNKCDLYFDLRGCVFIMEDDLLSGFILCIKGGQSDEKISHKNKVN